MKTLLFYFISMSAFADCGLHEFSGVVRAESKRFYVSVLEGTASEKIFAVAMSEEMKVLPYKDVRVKGEFVVTNNDVQQLKNLEFEDGAVLPFLKMKKKEKCL